MPHKKNVSNLQGERRQSERTVAYWEQKAREFNSRPMLTQLDPGQAIDAAEWGHRFIIAPDRLAELSTFLMCGSDVARLLEFCEGPLKYSVMFRQMPKRFRELFTQGCAYAAAAGFPSRMSGAFEREGGRRELYRTVFLPVGANLIFGSFSSVVREPQSPALRRPDDRFVREMAAVIGEIEGAGIVAPRNIAAALNERGILTARGRSWTAATVRSLRLLASE
jgi:hypothetical protein